MSWLFVVISIFITVLLVVFMKIFSVKIVKGISKEEKEKLIFMAKGSLEKINSLLEGNKDCASKLQLNTVTTQFNEVSRELSLEKEKLQGLEGELKVFQKKIDEKELIQQELKSSKEEDEKELEKLLADYNGISEEARKTEKELADQILSLDKQRENSELTSPQSNFLENLNETLEESAENLRTLITEHEQMVNRLTEIKQQLEDLENEYLKLVNKQLSE